MYTIIFLPVGWTGLFDPVWPLVEEKEDSEFVPVELCLKTDLVSLPARVEGLANISKVKLATIVEGDPKAPFSIATSPRCRGGRYSIPRIAPLYPWTVPYNAEC